MPSNLLPSQTAVYFETVSLRHFRSSSVCTLGMLHFQHWKEKEYKLCRRFLPFYCIILISLYISIIYNPLLYASLHTFKMYIRQYLEWVPPLWQHVEQTETYVAQQIYIWGQEKRHAHSETIYNPEEMITVFNLSMWVNKFTFLYCWHRAPHSCPTARLQNLKHPPNIYSYCVTRQLLCLKGGCFSSNWTFIKKNKTKTVSLNLILVIWSL